MRVEPRFVFPQDSAGGQATDTYRWPPSAPKRLGAPPAEAETGRTDVVERRSVPSRDLVPAAAPSASLVATRAAAPEPGGTATAAKRNGVDVRRATPRQMADLSMDLYMSGIVDWDEHALLSFQSELHPEYDRTVGALTGSKAAPDRPRDFITYWESRVAFEERHSLDADSVDRTRRVLAVLRQIDKPTRINL